MLYSGNYKNRLITKNDNALSLRGMICPTFQNEGTAIVYIDGRRVRPNQTFKCDIPDMVCSNAFSIVFEKDETKERLLYLGYGEAI